MGRRHRSSNGQAVQPPPRGHRDSAADPQSAPCPRFGWWIPALVALVTIAAFLPAVHNGFVTWDDDANFLNNADYRGLGWSQLGWMWTTSHMGHYIPLTWMTLGLDYVLWGMNPTGYHVTNLLLHAANAVLVFLLMLRILALVLPSDRQDRRILAACAAFGALLFAVHPLRVESVVWITERRDVLCGLFSLATLLAYLRARQDPYPGRRWYRVSIALYACALLSKSMAVPLAVVLLVVDAYPLRRIGGTAGWWNADARRVYAEKTPFLLLAATTSIVAFAALSTLGTAASLDQFDVASRAAVSAYGLGFYLWKTFVPIRLSPLYELPALLPPWPVVVSGTVVLAVTALATALRRRFPALLAVWTTYLLLLLPVLGVFQNGPQIAADRYTYLAVVPWTMLGSVAVLGVMRDWRESRVLAGAVALALIGVIAGLAALTWKQTDVWRDSETLWRHVVSLDPQSAVGHNNLGVVLERDGKAAEAIEEFEQALRLRPRYAMPHRNWGNALVRQGRFAEAIEHYAAALRIDPEDADAHNNLGAALIRHAAPAERLKSYFQLMAAISYGREVGQVPDQQAELAQAIEHFREALRIRPDYAAAHANWGLALSQQGKEHEADEHFEEARRLASVPAAPTRTWRRVGKAKQRRLPHLRPGIPPAVRWDAVTVLASRRDADDDDRWQLAQADVARGARAALGALARSG